MTNARLTEQLFALWEAAPDRLVFWAGLTPEHSAQLKDAMREREREIERTGRDPWTARQQEPAPAPSAQPAEARPSQQEQQQPAPAPELLTEPATFSPKVRRERRNLRASELRAIHRHTVHGVRWEIWFAGLCTRFGNHDPLLEEQVPPQELANVIGFTFAKKDLAEAKETERKRKHGLFNDDDTKWSIRTIGTSDMSREGRAAIYRERRYDRRKAKRKAERDKKRMEDLMSMQQQPLSYADDVAAFAGPQCETILDALGDDERRTVNELMVLLRRHPCWRYRQPDKFRKAILNRLDKLQAAGRIKSIYERRAEGGRERVVRRVHEGRKQ
jgi:hypothetical protein